MKITTHIIDDDADSRLVIRNYITENCPEIAITAEAESVKDALGIIKYQSPDLLLLDISLPDGTAFDLLRQVPDKQFEVIFITAHDEYAIQAFKFSAVDYLLKPIAYSELKEALQKVGDRINEKYFMTHWGTLTHNLQGKNNANKRLAIATGNGYVFVDLKEITRLESHSNYTHFYFVNGSKLVSSHTLGHFEELLPEDMFCRIHNSYIVSIDFIERYSKEGVGGTLIMKDGVSLSVSQRRKEVVYKKLIKGN
jgi:two-component system LytT family response regulator